MGRSRWGRGCSGRRGGSAGGRAARRRRATPTQATEETERIEKKGLTVLKSLFSAAMAAATEK
jgi:hypothetical protein